MWYTSDIVVEDDFDGTKVAYCMSAICYSVASAVSFIRAYDGLCGEAVLVDERGQLDAPILAKQDNPVPATGTGITRIRYWS
jgi:hypothetical protein